AMGKKKKEILDKEYVPFRDGMKANGYSDGAIKALWDVLVPFSDYAFNRAHTAGYGLVSYWTAYLKANYPAEYMAALLTSVADDKKPGESLTKAGAFDSLGHDRKGLHLVHAEAIDACLDTKRAEAVGQYDLFGGSEAGSEDAGVFDVRIPTGEWDKTVLLAYE